MCRLRPPVTWCRRGITREIWSWTRRLRLSAGRMRCWWKGTRWGHVAAGRDAYVCAALKRFLIKHLFCIQEVEEDRKKAEEEGMALQSRKGKADDLTITISKSTDVRVRSSITEIRILDLPPIYFLQNLFFSLCGSRRVVWWWQSWAAASLQLEKDSRSLDRTRGTKVQFMVLGKATGSSWPSPWLAKRSILIPSDSI